MGRSAELWIETLRTGSVRCFHFYILMGKRLAFGVQELGLAACVFFFFFPLVFPFQCIYSHSMNKLVASILLCYYQYSW